jgi:hypothetical protein
MSVTGVDADVESRTDRECPAEPEWVAVLAVYSSSRK